MTIETKARALAEAVGDTKRWVAHVTLGDATILEASALRLMSAAHDLLAALDAEPSVPAPAPSEDAPGAACSKCGEAFPSLRHREECVAAPSPPAPAASADDALPPTLNVSTDHVGVDELLDFEERLLELVVAHDPMLLDHITLVCHRGEEGEPVVNYAAALRSRPDTVAEMLDANGVAWCPDCHRFIVLDREGGDGCSHDARLPTLEEQYERDDRLCEAVPRSREPTDEAVAKAAQEWREVLTVYRSGPRSAQETVRELEAENILIRAIDAAARSRAGKQT